MSKRRFQVPSKFLLGTCAVVVVIAVIATAAYRVTNTAKTTQSEASTSVSSVLSAQSIVSRLGSSLSAEYSYLHSIPPVAQTTVGYQVPGSSFQVVLPVAASSVAFTDTGTNNEQTTYNNFDKAATTINSYLVRHGFATLPAQDQADGLLSSVYFYKRSDAVCQVSVYTDLSLACSPIAELTSIASQAQPLVPVYEDAAPDSGTALVTAPDIRASETAGYTIATLSIYNNHGETSANFYKQGSGAWHIVELDWYNDPHEDADIIPNCAYFDSFTPVREAFTGQACYDSATRAMRVVNG